MRRVTALLLVAGSAAAALLGDAAERTDATIPHRLDRLQVDASLEDWPATALLVTIAEPAPRDRTAARVTVRVCWDRTALWAGFEVEDTQVHLPPADASGPALFQWDSIEIYLDALGDRAGRMGPDDFQVIVTADGRTAVLEGDPLLAEVEPLSVPKRERDGVAIPVAARPTPAGYVVELALPWAAFGVTPSAGTRLALDLAVNDWDAGHPQLPMYGYDLATLNAIASKPTGAPGEFDSHGLSGDAADRFTAAHYHPWAWSGSSDFGHPTTWEEVRLVGSAPLLEQLEDRVGTRTLIVLAGCTLMVLAGAALGGLEIRHRRQVAQLIPRLAAIDTAEPDEAGLRSGERHEAPAVLGEHRPTRPEPVDSLETRIDDAARRDTGSDPGGPPPRLASRAVGIVGSRVAEPLTPAQLAEELCVSLRTLQRELASGLRCTPRELIIAVKMREARRLLAAGWRVQEVAGRVGFDDTSHFSRRFKAYVGVPPSEIAARAATDSSAA